jgi:hypothetical protein
MNEQTAYNIVCIATVTMAVAMLGCLYLAPSIAMQIISAMMCVGLLVLGAVVYKLAQDDKVDVE